MKKLVAVFFLLLASCPAYSQAPAAAQQQMPLNCQVGPVRRTFGNSTWLVYSCEDERSLVIATTADNPARPFYFTFFPDNGHYHLHGEGDGSKQEAADAFKEIQRLSQQDIYGLIAATKAVNASTPAN